MRCRILIVAIVVSCMSVVHADDRLPIPDAAAQKEADDLVQDVYGDQIKAATSSDEKRTLTNKLLEVSSQSDTIPPSRYAVLKAALDVAPDAIVAMSVIDNMAQYFEIDSLNAKAYTIRRLAKSSTTTSERKAVAECAVQVMEIFVKQDDFDAAIALIEIGLDAATRSRDSELIRSIRSRKGEVDLLKRQYADVQVALATLEADPTDAKSNSIVGKYRCFAKSEWEDGLPMLALGEDEGLKEVALKELARPEISGDQVAIADGWFELAQASNESKKAGMLQRATLWYTKALPSLSGLMKAKAEQRIQVAEMPKNNLAEPTPELLVSHSWLRTGRYRKDGVVLKYVFTLRSDGTCSAIAINTKTKTSWKRWRLDGKKLAFSAKDGVPVLTYDSGVFSGSYNEWSFTLEPLMGEGH